MEENNEGSQGGAQSESGILGALEDRRNQYVRTDRQMRSGEPAKLGQVAARVNNPDNPQGLQSAQQMAESGGQKQ